MRAILSAVCCLLGDVVEFLMRIDRIFHAHDEVGFNVSSAQLDNELDWRVLADIVDLAFALSIGSP